MTVKLHYDIEQGTQEWHDIRNIHVTGTDSYKLLRGKKVSEILREKQIATSTFSGNRATRRGHTLEPIGRRLTEQLKNVEIEEVGFITNSAKPLVGYSPDGLIGTDGLWENKAFNEQRHRANSVHPDIEIQTQVQWGLFVSERLWAFLTFINPDIDPAYALKVILIKRNENAMKKFERLMEEHYERARNSR